MLNKFKIKKTTPTRGKKDFLMLDSTPMTIKFQKKNVE